MEINRWWEWVKIENSCLVDCFEIVFVLDLVMFFMCNRDNMVRLKDKKKDVENGEVDEIKDDLRIDEFIMDYEEFVKRVCVIVKFFVSRKFIKWLYKIVKKGKCGVYLYGLMV